VNKDTAIVVLYYNKLRLTLDCVRSVLEAGYAPQEVTCFDNGSKREVFQQVQQEFPLCCHLRIEKNRGFSGGFNRSLEQVFASGYETALFCTNDTLIEPGAAEACEQTAAETGAGMVAPLITYLSNPQAIDSSGAYFDAQTGILHHYHEYGLPKMLDPAKDYIPGTAVWIDKQTFNALDGTDESFHMYWEDVDMCFRAHRLGIPLARCYDARIGHGVGQTNRKKPLYTTFYFHRNRIRFCRRYLQDNVKEQVLERIRDELTQMGSLWQEKGDKRRMGYLNELMKELTLSHVPKS
jgi:GT2 family glycosyltransferase